MKRIILLVSVLTFLVLSVLLISCNSDISSSEGDTTTTCVSHVSEYVPHKEATCTEEGLSTGIRCSVCGTVIKEQEIIKKKNHVYTGGDCIVCQLPAPSDGLKYSLSADGSSYIVTDMWMCDDKVIIIPQVHNGLPVTEIADEAFSQCEFITEVVIPQTVTKIGENAFYRCARLKKVDMSYGLITIEAKAFYGCASLEKISIPHSVTHLGEASLGNCYALAFVEIGDGIEAIGKNVLANSYGLVSVTLGRNVKAIDKEAFSSCNKILEIYNLSQLKVEKGSDTYGALAKNAVAIHTVEDAKSIIDKQNEFLFAAVDNQNYLVGYVDNYSQVTLPDSYKSGDYKVYKYAFYGSTCLKKVYFGSKVTEIGENAFGKCPYLEYVEIPSNVKKIGAYAFSNCRSLYAIVLREGITEIGDYAFSQLDSLVVISLPNSLNTVGKDIFANCPNLKTIHGSEKLN